MDNKAQMMVMETTIFAITVILGLAFLFQLSPSSTLTDTYSNELKIWGDDALRTLYTEPYTADALPANYPSNKLVYYLITNDYDNMTSELNNFLEDKIMYNIWISNGTQPVFWCNSLGYNDTPLSSIGSVTISHSIIPIDPVYLNNATGIFSGKYKEGKKSDLDNKFEVCDSSSYDIILEMWETI
jgi:hypothetical protein